MTFFNTESLKTSRGGKKCCAKKSQHGRTKRNESEPFLNWSNQLANLPLLKQPRDGRFFMRERLQRVNSNTLSLFVAFLFYFTAAVIIEGISSLIIVGHAMAKKNLPSCAVECQFAIFPQHITRLSYTIDLIPLDRFDYQGVFYRYVRNKKIIKMELALVFT